MPDRTTIAYTYDGSFAGLLCCIFDSYLRKERPVEILLEGDPTFYPRRQIQTDPAHAKRVWRSLLQISQEAADWVAAGWASCAPNRETALYQFVCLLYQYGAKVTSLFADPAVDRVFRMVRTQRNEAHLYTELLRFSEYGGGLVAVISPKCLVLPQLARHFADRFPEEAFLIYDEAHRQGLFYRPYQWTIQPVERLDLNRPEEGEQCLRELWQRYYDTTSIQGRYNPKCRQTHCPKRFWKHMTEMEGCNPLESSGGQQLAAPAPPVLPADVSIKIS